MVPSGGIGTRFVILLGLKLGYRYLDTTVATLEEQFDLQLLFSKQKCLLYEYLILLYELLNVFSYS